MSEIALLIDSTTDLPAALVGLPHVRMVPLRINWDSETFRDRVDLSTQAFYERLRTASTMPSTSAPPPGDFEQAYEELLQTYRGVIGVHLPAALSATYSGSVSAAQRISPDRIRVVAGGSCSFAVGWLAERALAIATETGDLDAAADAARAMVSRTRLLATLDTLEYLKRGGRIGRVAALAGALLNVKPILQIDNGQVLPVERARSRGAALRRMKELTLELGPLERVAVLHGDAPAAADELAASLAEALPGIVIERGEISPVVGVHGGPGTVAVTCLLRSP